MRRFLRILPLFTLLAACSEGMSGGLAPQPEQQARASFPRGAVVDVIRIDALDTLPLRAADLVAPDGTTTAASSVDVRGNPRTEGGQAMVANPWRSDLIGTVRTSAAPLVATNASMRSQSELLATISVAEIALPDPVAYRRDWANYRIRLGFGAPGGQTETRDIPAPEPPPS